MPQNHPIVTVTMNPSLDVSAEVDRLAPDDKLRCRNVRHDPGGGGINVSRAVQILGGHSRAIYPAGGSTGKHIEKILEEEHIDSQPVWSEKRNRESLAVREIASGKQYRFVLPGPEYERREWEKCLQAAAELEPAPDFVVASGSLAPGIPGDFYVRLIDIFLGKNTKTVLDTSGDPLKKTQERRAYLIAPNRRELEEFCGCALNNKKKQEKICRDLVARGWCEILVLTLGQNGALLTTEDEQLRLPGLEVEETSSIGAGDSFIAGMVTKLQQQEDVRTAFLYGMAAGTAALLTRGTELCRRKDTDKFFSILQEKAENKP